MTFFTSVFTFFMPKSVANVVQYIWFSVEHELVLEVMHFILVLEKISCKREGAKIMASTLIAGFAQSHDRVLHIFCFYICYRLCEVHTQSFEKFLKITFVIQHFSIIAYNYYWGRSCASTCTLLLLFLWQICPIFCAKTF